MYSAPSLVSNNVQPPVGPKNNFKQIWKLYIMGSVAVDENGIPVGQKERPNRLFIGVQETKLYSTFLARTITLISEIVIQLVCFQWLSLLFVWLTKGMFAWNCFKTKLRDTPVELLETREGAEYIVSYILV